MSVWQGGEHDKKMMAIFDMFPQEDHSVVGLILTNEYDIEKVVSVARRLVRVYEAMKAAGVLPA